jgi:hypothetical protein
MEIAVLQFTRKIVMEPRNLEVADFQLLRDHGLADADVARILGIAAWSLGQTVVGPAIEPQPGMPAFTRALQR